ncbi:MAG TPA: glucose 1-dehydrogenase [Lacipirellulaceae bacterium]|nr:glucose 1-dehydrogenase [Lacipirellulaceae bacterium]HMP05571.1 glucose 1-dehydrogenase [Lacipirellulaceae bacterium]
MKVNLKGKRALVTGAAQGIGKAIAEALAANGARVAYADINGELAKQSAEGVDGAISVTMDITDKDQVQNATAEAAQKLGGIDILVNNAGVNTAKHRVNIDQFPLEEWNRLVAVDLTGTYLVTQAVAKFMIVQGGGRIVNIASALGVVPARRQCAFIAAKGGMIHMTKGTAIELAPNGILVNCVAPGSTLTEGTKSLFYGETATEKEYVQRMLSHVPLGRPGTCEEMAHAVLFLVAPESSYITGQVLCVDGGWTAGGFLRDF